MKVYIFSNRSQICTFFIITLKPPWQFLANVTHVGVICGGLLSEADYYKFTALVKMYGILGDCFYGMS